MYSELKKIMKVYLVDDDQLSLTILEDALKKKFGDYMKIQSFETGESCLAGIAAEVPHLIILDYHLDSQTQGAANGVDILKRIKGSHPEVQVIMLSGQAKIDIAVETMRLGARDYVVKGETSGFHLSQIITNIIETSAQANELRSYKIGFWIAVAIISANLIGVLILYNFFPEHVRHLHF